MRLLLASPLLLARQELYLRLLLVSPPVDGMSGGVEACMTVLVRRASSFHGMRKLELLPLLFLNVLPSCSGVLLHCAWLWRSVTVFFAVVALQPSSWVSAWLWKQNIRKQSASLGW